ncbi:MAG: hypothetical protein ACYDA4_09980 [Ignavibacteriaceae bacterium]
MNISIDKKKLTGYLFAIAIFLLAANLIVTKIYKSKIKPHKAVEIDDAEINKIFLQAVFDFGIQKSWVKQKRISDFSNDSLLSSYSIEVPNDLPIAEILQEIYSSLHFKNVQMICHEKTIGGENNLNIYSNDKLKLKASFNYSPDIRRIGGMIGMVITGLENLSESKIARIIMAPETYTAALIPSKKTSELADSLILNRKQYDVLINNNIKEMNFELNEHFPKDRLGNAIRDIIGAFPDAQYYIIDDKSKLYSSKVYAFIKNELTKRGIKIVLESSIAHLESGSDQQIENNFRSIAHQSDGGNQIFIEVPADYYFTIKPDVSALIKIGYKFISTIRPPK